MNIVKLVILFCDHCVLLCNMCKMFGIPPPPPAPPLLCKAVSLDALALVVDKFAGKCSLVQTHGVCSPSLATRLILKFGISVS